jgi:ABC-type oligopeptide transport system ATPase subunit
MRSQAMTANMIEVKDLCVYYPQRGGLLNSIKSYTKAVNGVSFQLKKGSCLGILGESGSGKSTLGLALLGLTPIYSGELKFEEALMDTQKQSAWSPWKKRFQMVFQDSSDALNPKRTIFEIFKEVLTFHKICAEKEVKAYIADLLQKVGLEPNMMHRFPHAFSGGQRQRLGIARSLCVEPELLICDEIVSALDVRVQADILDLLDKLRKEMNLTLLFIAHDLAVVYKFCDETLVMQNGKIVEQGPVDQVLVYPTEEYTQKLLSAIPIPDPSFYNKA